MYTDLPKMLLTLSLANTFNAKMIMNAVGTYGATATTPTTLALTENVRSIAMNLAGVKSTNQHATDLEETRQMSKQRLS